MLVLEVGIDHEVASCFNMWHAMCLFLLKVLLVTLFVKQDRLH